MFLNGRFSTNVLKWIEITWIRFSTNVLCAKMDWNKVNTVQYDSASMDWNIAGWTPHCYHMLVCEKHTSVGHAGLWDTLVCRTHWSVGHDGLWDTLVCGTRWSVRHWSVGHPGLLNTLVCGTHWSVSQAIKSFTITIALITVIVVGDACD